MQPVQLGYIRNASRVKVIQKIFVNMTTILLSVPPYSLKLLMWGRGVQLLMQLTICMQNQSSIHLYTELSSVVEKIPFVSNLRFKLLPSYFTRPLRQWHHSLDGVISSRLDFSCYNWVLLFHTAKRFVYDLSTQTSWLCYNYIHQLFKLTDTLIFSVASSCSLQRLLNSSLLLST